MCGLHVTLYRHVTVVHVPRVTLMAVRKLVLLAVNTSYHRVDFSKEEWAPVLASWIRPRRGKCGKTGVMRHWAPVVFTLALLCGLPFPSERGEEGGWWSSRWRWEASQRLKAPRSRPAHSLVHPLAAPFESWPSKAGAHGRWVHDLTLIRLLHLWPKLRRVDVRRSSVNCWGFLNRRPFFDYMRNAVRMSHHRSLMIWNCLHHFH